MVEKMKMRIKVRNWDGSWTEDILYEDDPLEINMNGMSIFNLSLKDGVIEIDAYSTILNY
jgi:hypothetical protein